MHAIRQAWHSRWTFKDGKRLGIGLALNLGIEKQFNRVVSTSALDGKKRQRLLAEVKTTAAL